MPSRAAATTSSSRPSSACIRHEPARRRRRAARSAPASRSPCARRSRAPSVASAPTTSTSTTSTASTRHVPIEDVIGQLAELVERGQDPPHRPVRGRCRRPSAARTPSTRSPRCRASTRCGRATPRATCSTPCASSASASCPTRRSAAGSSPAPITKPSDLDSDDFRLGEPALPAGGLRREHAHRRRGQATSRTRSAPRPAQVALAWLLAQGDDIVPIPGTKRVARLEENVAADHIELTASHVARLKLPSASGERYEPGVAWSITAGRGREPAGGRSPVVPKKGETASGSPRRSSQVQAGCADPGHVPEPAKCRRRSRAPMEAARHEPLDMSRPVAVVDRLTPGSPASGSARACPRCRLIGDERQWFGEHGPAAGALAVSGETPSTKPPSS